MERKEPTISGSIKPEKDEVRARQPRDPKRAASGTRPPDDAAPPPPPRPPSGQPPKGGGGGSALAIVALVVALAGVGGSGFMGWQWMQTEDDLVQAKRRIEGLERRLDITSDQSSEYVEEIQEKLQWADSEIRKLWGVAYDTNRGRINANRESIEALTSQLSSVESTADSANSRLGELRSALDETRNRVSSVNEALEELKQAAGSMEDQRRRLQNLSEDVDRLDRSLANLGGLAERVSTNEEAIEAIDSFRRSVNRELISIKEQL